MSFFVGLVAGIVFGFTLVVAFLRSQNARSQHRMELAAAVTAFARMTMEDCRKLFRVATTTSSECYCPSWVDFSKPQKLKWLNSYLTIVWPYINEAATELIKKSVEPTLELHRPAMVLSSLKFSIFTLGTVAPQFTGWFLLLLLLAMIQYILIVKDIGFTGVFRLIFKPTLEELPRLGNIRFSLRQKKNLDSQLEIGGDEFTSIPGLFGALEDIIGNAIVNSFTCPVRTINLWNPLPGISDALEDVIDSAIGNSITWPIRKIVPVLFKSRNPSIPRLPNPQIQLYVALTANSYIIRTANNYLHRKPQSDDGEPILALEGNEPNPAAVGLAQWQEQLVMLATQTARISLTMLVAAFRTGTSRPIWSSAAELCDLGRDSDNATVYLRRARALADRLAAVGLPVSDEKLVRRILRGLGPRYRPFIRSVLGRPFPVTYEELNGLILELDATKLHSS
ncbi:unnamed protein product [Linum tenue]|uniref:SMP-LTD domain-containing protein n=1 Tax=Linum tenue TaxID=586396 RepID=A0AAV0HUS3_9ROSI|nr:unnamed protein product [Linum tenue]